MPSGKIHTINTLLITLPSMVLFDVITGDLSPAVAAGLGCVSGILITPDLDLGGGKMPWSSRKLLGRVGAKLWKGLWYPYSRLIPHRSWISHSPLISTLIRVFYLCWPLIIFWPQIFQEPLFWVFVLGLVISDLFHIGLDRLT